MENEGFEIGEINKKRQSSVVIDWGTQKVSNLSLSWEDLEASVSLGKGKGTKQIIHRTNGIAEGGKLTAIMGSSGAGKSTMMNILARRNLAGIDIQGTTRVNGQAYTTKISNVSSYVQQDDIFIGTLTVREYITFIVRLRLSEETKIAQEKRIDDLITMMSLSACQDSVIGQPGLTKTISGGEMKRLSVACGMATNPSFLFLDEPTSGLDTSLAFQVVALLKQLTQLGTTVLCTIHQPSSEIFQMFDNLILLSLGKRVFAGPLAEAKVFFTSQGLPCQEDYNPADHYIWETTISLTDSDGSMKKVHSLADAFENGETEKHNRQLIKASVANASSDNILRGAHSKPGLSIQLKMLFWRAAKAKYQDKVLLRLQLQQNLTTALIFGLVFLRVPRSVSQVPYDVDDRYALQGCSFVFIITNFFQHLYGVLFVFPYLTKIFRREVYDGSYGIGAAVMTQFITDIPHYTLLPCMTSMVVYFMAGYSPGFLVFFNIWCSIMGNIFCATGLGYVVSAIADSVAVANAITGPVASPLLLFSGLFIRASRIPVYFFWMKYISWFYYSVENIFIGQWTFNDNSFTCEPDTATRIQLSFHREEKQFLDIAQTFHRNKFECSTEIAQECICYDDYISNKYSINATHVKVDGETILEDISFDSGNLLRNYLCMGAIAFLLRLVTWLILKRKFRSSNR